MPPMTTHLDKCIFFYLNPFYFCDLADYCSLIKTQCRQKLTSVDNWCSSFSGITWKAVFKMQICGPYSIFPKSECWWHFKKKKWNLISRIQQGLNKKYKIFWFADFKHHRLAKLDNSKLGWSLPHILCTLSLLLSTCFFCPSTYSRSTFNFCFKMLFIWDPSYAAQYREWSRHFTRVN